MDRKILIKYLEYVLYPGKPTPSSSFSSSTSVNSVKFQDKDGTYIVVGLEELQREFEKMLAELNND